MRNSFFPLGRTGRAGKQGVAITFLTNDDDEVMWVSPDLFLCFAPLVAEVNLDHVFLEIGMISSKVRRGECERCIAID